MRTHHALAPLAWLLATGCAASRPASAPPPAPPPSPAPSPSPPRVSGRVALAVHDPTELGARLALQLRASLAARGVDVVLLGAKSAPEHGLIVDVFVLNRLRKDERVRDHELGTRVASGVGLVGGSDDPERLPEQHNATTEPFDYGRTFMQSDLRIIVTASLRRAGVARPLAQWDDEEGTLVRWDEGASPAANPWQAVYAAVAEQLAGQIAGALRNR
jgi:hypothetical protein